MLLAYCNGCPCLNQDNEEGDTCNLGYPTGYVDAMMLIDEQLTKVTSATMSNDCKMVKVCMNDHEDIFPDLQHVNPLNKPIFTKPIY